MSTINGTVNSKTKISMPRLLMHLEGLALLAASIVVYGLRGFGWGTLALLLLFPDLPLILYAWDKRVASISYNLLHTLVFPIALGIASLTLESELGLQIGLIWLAHIGMDHAFGYGFKYLGAFKETHFSRV